MSGGQNICIIMYILNIAKHWSTGEPFEKIRPHRFGGEGVLIGGQTATLNA